MFYENKKIGFTFYSNKIIIVIIKGIYDGFVVEHEG